MDKHGPEDVLDRLHEEWSGGGSIRELLGYLRPGDRLHCGGQECVVVPVKPTEAEIRAVDRACHERWPNARQMAISLRAAMLAALTEAGGDD